MQLLTCWTIISLWAGWQGMDLVHLCSHHCVQHSAWPITDVQQVFKR
jgi:hypothetical protein